MKNVRDAKANRRYEVIIYGDSITAGIRDITANETWAKYMKGLFGGRSFAAWGAPGNTSTDLVWRVMKGGEVQSNAPRAVAVFIGTNDLSRGRDPAKYMDFILKLMKNRYPSSKILLMNILPTTRPYQIGPTNAAYAKIAAANGATFLTCGSDINIRDPELSADGLHLTPAGYGRVIPCIVKNL